jgi:DNA-directed RNA polymerase specialized sigma subunit
VTEHCCRQMSKRDRELWKQVRVDIPTSSEPLANVIRDCCSSEPMCAVERFLWSRPQKQWPLARDVLYFTYAKWGESVAGNLWTRLKPLVELDDLKQKVAWGIVEGIDRFDPSRQVPFVRYVPGRIMNRVFDAEVRRASERDYQLMMEVLEAQEALAQQLRGTPSPQDIAVAIRKPVTDVYRAVRIRGVLFPCSFDAMSASAQAASRDDGGSSARAAEAHHCLSQVVAVLTQDGQTQVRLRVVGKTHAEIAREFNTHRPADRQVTPDSIGKAYQRYAKQMALVGQRGAVAPARKAKKCRNH